MVHLATFQIPALRNADLTSRFALLAVRESTLVAIPQKLTRDAKRDSAERQPSMYLITTAKSLTPGPPPLQAANPVLLMTSTALEHLRWQFVRGGPHRIYPVLRSEGRRVSCSE
jgi:hypothetical protein